MTREKGSFQDNIRRTFIRFSIVPVATIVTVLLVLFVFSWEVFTASFNKQENENIADEITRITNIYYEMMDDVYDVLKEKEESFSSDDIFRVLYGRTEEFGEIGNLYILSGEQEILFTSKGSAPKLITESTYKNWGALRAVNLNKEDTVTILYDKTLYIVKGVYEKNRLKFAIIYTVPGDVISQAASGQNRYIVITDKNGWIYASNNRIFRDNLGQIDKQIADKTGYIKYNGTVFYSYRSHIDKGLFVYTFTNVGRSIEIITILTAIIAVIFVAIALITLRSTAKSSLEYTKDIKKIEDALEEVQNGNFDVSLNIDSSTEFKVIGNDFNDMLSGLKEQIRQNQELAENAAFSQVKQLESQFNPHFLFNTLDNIRFMAKIDAAAADKMIVSLSGLLRYSIREIREEVTVKEDLDNLQYYLNILQIRFNKRFAYKLDVAEDIMECLIPKLLIQPLLENAVKYGFGTKEKLTVTIRGYQMQEMLVFVCEDDGAGIKDEQLLEIQSNLKEDSNTTPHYGLYNIHRRIRLMYKGDYGLDISSKVDEGTTVRLTIPKHME